MNKLIPIIVFIFLAAGACSDEGKSQEKQDHVWKEQTEALDKAKAVEGILKESARTQEQQIQEDTQ